MPEYCFVFGCARSGTTALTRLLHAHPEVIVGMERYKYLVNSTPEEFGPDLFERERFLDFRPGDTNITPDVERFRLHYETAAKRFEHGDVRFVGDKMMARVPASELLEARLDRPKVVFIYRDLYRVASSFAARARDPGDIWPTSGTHDVALSRWLEAFDAIRILRGTNADDVFLVRYERLLSGDWDACRAMFGFLGLDVEPEVADHFVAATARWNKHETKPLGLSTEEIELLDKSDHVEILAEFDRAADHDIGLYLR